MAKIFRDTKQRAAILETLQDYGHPMTARHIRDSAAALVPTLGIATVYRNIRSLLAAGEIEQIDVPGATSYYTIPRKGNHLMVICKDSQRVELIPGAELSVSFLKNLPHDFKARSFQLFVLGHFLKEEKAS